MNIPNELEKSKMNCDSAKLYNGTNYCNWDMKRKKCVPQCNRYEGETECVKSSDCKFLNGKCQDFSG